MAQKNLEGKVYYNHLVSEEEKRKFDYEISMRRHEFPVFKALTIERARIKEAYIGLNQTPEPLSTRGHLELNLSIEFEKLEKLAQLSALGVTYTGTDDIEGMTGNQASATYTGKEDIEGLMNDLNANRLEELAGKRVFAYSRRELLVGISAPFPVTRAIADGTLF